VLRNEEVPQVTISVLRIIVNNVIGPSWGQFPVEPFKYGGTQSGDFDGSSTVRELKEDGASVKFD
jgi:hypothetical protein